MSKETQETEEIIETAPKKKRTAKPVPVSTTVTNDPRVVELVAGGMTEEEAISLIEAEDAANAISPSPSPVNTDEIKQELGDLLDMAVQFAKETEEHIAELTKDGPIQITLNDPPKKEKGKRTVKPTEQDTEEQNDARNAAFGGDPNYVVPSFGKADQERGFTNALGLESTETHRHVAKVWQEQCFTLPEIRDSIGRASESKKDEHILLSSLRMKQDDKGYVALSNDSPFTGFGLNSAWRHAGLPDGVLKFLAHPDHGGKYNGHIVTLYNDAIKGVEKGDQKDALVRFRNIPNVDGGSTLAVRAIRSRGFTIIDNDAVMALVMNAIPKEAHKHTLASHVVHDGDNIVMNILPPDYVKRREDSEYGVGIAVKNSEVGESPLTVEPFLFRAICYNGMIWGRRDATEANVTQRHSGMVNWTELQEKINRAVLAALTEGQSLLTQMDLAKQVQVHDLEKLVVYLSETNGLNRTVGRAWWNGYQETLQNEGTKAEVEGNFFGLVQGLTLAAQGFTGFTRNGIERTAGQILAEELTDGIERMRDRVARAEQFADRRTGAQVDHYLYGRVEIGQDAPVLTMEAITG